MNSISLLVCTSALIVSCAQVAFESAELEASSSQELKACTPYLQRQSDGSVRMKVQFSTRQAYVEVFVKKNGQQVLAQNIVASESQNADGTCAYQHVMSASALHEGDALSVRFYSYELGKPGTFTPGPGEATWSPEVVLSADDTCETAPPAAASDPLAQQLANGAVRFTATFAEPQAYVEVFAKQNGVQNVAVNITGSGVANDDGSVTYSLTVPASQYRDGDEIVARFYSYGKGKPGAFTPGPTPQDWSAALYFDSDGPDSVCEGEFCRPAVLVEPGQLSCSNAFTASNDVVFVADGAQVKRFDARTGAALETFIATEEWVTMTIVEGLTVVGDDLFYRHLTTFDSAARFYRLPGATDGAEWEYLTGVDFGGPGYRSFGANSKSVFFGPNMGLLYSYDRGTGELAQLPAFVGNVRKIRATEDRIFWTESPSGAYTAAADGSDVAGWFSEGVSYFESFGNELYFTSPSGSIDKVGTDGTTITLGLDGTLIGVDQSGIYYNTAAGVARAELDGGNESIISSEPLAGVEFAVTEDGLLGWTPCADTFAGQVVRLAK